MHRLMDAHEKTLLLNTRLFDNCLAGVDDTMARRRPNEHTNHMAFLACHLVESRYFLAGLLGSSVVCPFAAQLDGVRSVAELREVPALVDVRAAWAASTAILSERFAELDEGDLRRPVEQSFPIDDRTLLGAIAFLLQHEAYHVGQLALLRKFFALGPMAYT